MSTAQGNRREPAYRRSAGSSRGLARRQELLEKVSDDLAANGLVDFSLRRAARASGTTHKVLLYYFDGADDLLQQALTQLRDRRIGNALDAAATSGGTLAQRVQSIWPVLLKNETGLRVIDQAVGLAMYDPDRYGGLAREASRQYMPALLSLCPQEWDQRRKQQVAEMLLAVFRGFLIELATSTDTAGIELGLNALVRALECEESRPVSAAPRRKVTRRPSRGAVDKK